MDKLESYLSYLQEAGFTKYPKGWDRSSVQKFAKSVGGDPKTKKWFEKCVKKMEGNISDPEAFCASVKDEVYGGDKASTYWRGKGKTKKQAAKSVSTMRRKLK